jgi:broad-specificity NMP kinase
MIIKKNESFPERPVIIVLYGTPGCGKTSLFNTCDQPILIDCDRGADRAINRQDTIIAKNWQEVIESESEIKNYKTVGIDTAKAVLDVMGCRKGLQVENK